ncbi:DsbA family oxidoreductase [Microbulbifer agarilyticus]|uniref:DsbA family oxidoreductase n=1 Tax=Microbulbifer agarilyticus TaxID=260552 RepID=UPI001C96CAA1|nr:DsbA family oxidoreductase [Microbulbifer agarilyticus]MBY6190325.1 DsbA family oxidoreductase [Microbulbifer agarilyticus]MCA0892816.1 DsbA family oxidoreductase [Microbulbifer agarilyticus]
MAKTYLRIDIVSDVVCPWCVIGFKRLEQALAKFPGQFEPNFVWHPFELNPQMPEAGENLREHMVAKYQISPEESLESRERLKEIGSALGFDFNFSDEMRIYNTNHAHRLLHWAEPTGRQTELQMRLFEDYFTHGKNLNHERVLLDAVDSVGLNREEASAALHDAAIKRQTLAREEQLLMQGISGVPLFMFNHDYAISGAEETSVFEAQLQQLAESGN